MVSHKAHNLEVAGSIPALATIANLAQLVEQFLGRKKVSGSIPLISTSFFKKSIGQNWIIFMGTN